MIVFKVQTETWEEGGTVIQNPLKPCKAAVSGWHVFRPKTRGETDSLARCALCGLQKEKSVE